MEERIEHKRMMAISKNKIYKAEGKK